MLNLVNTFVPDAVRSTVTLKELETNAALLRDLNVWYRNNIPEHEIETSVLYENLPVRGYHRLIVDAASSDPGVNGVTPICIEADHLSICKANSEDDPVYMSVADFIKRTLTPNLPRIDLTFTQFVKLFNDIRRDAAKLEEFQESSCPPESNMDGIYQRCIA